MSRIVVVLVACFLLALCGCRARQATVVPPEEYRRVDGEGFAWPLPEDHVALVVLFVRRDCARCSEVAPEVGQIHDEYAPRGVGFVVVYAEADAPIEEAARHAKDNAYPRPALLDPKMVLARRYGISVVPEVVLLDSDMKVAYRGRVDDRYIDHEQQRPVPLRRDLREALDDLLSGQAVRMPHAPAVGQKIEFPPSPEE